MTSGFTRTYTSASPTVVAVSTTGRARSIGAGNGVVVVRDSVDPGLKVQGTATIRVNQVTASIRNTPALPDTLKVGVGGRRAIIARPAAGCPGSSLKRIQIPANTTATSVLMCGVTAGRVTVVAQDSAGIFLPDTMVVTVVSTIEFREIGQFSRQSNFYVNQNETHKAQVFLSDPAPAGGLGVTFVYGQAGTSGCTPAPAIIPAGQLSATVTIQGLARGRDSVVPTSGGFVGKFAYVDVARDSLQLAIPYPSTVGVGQTNQPYVAYTYVMDHPLTAALSRDTNVVAVDVASGRVAQGQSAIAVYNALRAQPSAGGDSTWIVLTAPGYRPDSLLVHVSRPALTLNMSYPYQVLVGGKFQN